MNSNSEMFNLSRITRLDQLIFRLGLVCLLTASHTPWVQAAPASMTQAEARHFLLRTGFAPTPQEIAAITGQSAEQVVARTLDLARSAIPSTPTPRFTQLPVQTAPGANAGQQERLAYRYQQRREGIEIKTWWMAEMMSTATPLRERMTLFWHNHFATSQLKVTRSMPMWQQHQTLRREALGSFRRLVHQIAKDPAMLIYLDGANSRREAPNENFAREVMELFILGEASQGGGYTERDIKEAARAFTGWSLESQSLQFRLRPGFHDPGQKTVLGQTGPFDGDAVLEILMDQDAAAEFITRKLWLEFVAGAVPGVATSPEGTEFRRIAQAFRHSGYDISALMKDLLLSDAFWHEDKRAALVKSPVDLVVGMARQLNMPASDALVLASRSAMLGQNLLGPPNVKGWPGNHDWINATSLLERKAWVTGLFAPPVASSMTTNLPLPSNGMVNATQRQSLGFNPAELQAMGREGVAKLAFSLLNIRLNIEPWLTLQGLRSDVEPYPQQQQAMVDALLAAPPMQRVPEGTVARNWVRALMSDPAYQLK